MCSKSIMKTKPANLKAIPIPKDNEVLSVFCKSIWMQCLNNIEHHTSHDLKSTVVLENFIIETFSKFLYNQSKYFKNDLISGKLCVLFLPNV